MKTQKILIVLFSLLILFSCKKNDDPTDGNKMANLKVPDDFEWSVTENIVIGVNTIGVSDGSTLVLYDLDGNIIDKQRILNSQVEFDVQIQNITDSLRLYSPETRISEYFPVSANNVVFGSGTFKNADSRIADYALDFYGADKDYIKIDNNGQGGIVTGFPFTFGAWVKTKVPSEGNDDMVLVNIANPNYASKYYGICIRKYGKKYKPVIVARNGGSERVKSYNQNLADNTWHQVVGVFVSDKERKIYVDGVYRGKSTSEMTFDEKATITDFGRWADNTPSGNFNGLMDNVCVWDKALNDDEVKKFYINGLGGNETKLKGYWNFNEGTGVDIKNSSAAGGYNGTNSGAKYILISDPIPDSDGDGVNDDDDDFPNDDTRAYRKIYPTGDNYCFQTYEDLWPDMGDYDFNDVVLRNKMHIYKNAQNKLVGGRVMSLVYWIGGGLPRGVGMEWFTSNENATKLSYMPENTVVVTEVDNVVADPVVLNAVQVFNGNVIESLNDSVDFEFTWDYSLGGKSLWIQVYIYNERSHEVHSYGHPPTKAQDMLLFGTRDDASQTKWNWTPGKSFENPADFYKTSTNLPWGLEIVTEEFRVPIEKTEIIDAYPQFKVWAESGGTENKDWYNYPDKLKTFLPDEL